MTSIKNLFVIQETAKGLAGAESIWSSEAFMVAAVGLVGAVIGSFATVVSSIAVDWYRRRAERVREKPMKRLLLKMLSDNRFSWRELDTLMHVIGADEPTTKRLLLDLGARASEDGKRTWGLVSRNPLP